ncbi:MAG: RnfH family protein [Gammaproteobacteria bacterium]|nr:MAG: RnfH family protein [Gammaproteobacteria bacterium]
MAPDRIEVEVACAVGDRQRLLRLVLPAGSTARAAVLQSGLEAEFPDLDLARLPLAIYGELVSDERVLADGDRVEVCRPLARDPRELRRELAARGLTMAGRPARRR